MSAGVPTKATTSGCVLCMQNSLKYPPPSGDEGEPDIVPENPVLNQAYLDTKENRIKIFNGESWDTIGDVEYNGYLYQL